ncbi:Titin like protein [Argiope bruennichi]|uniref:Titin like protein n=1 Tax=Argiope bruennichi TaxID=94029 RepID=A0A8T0E1K3_ARGBR|nr:Titin like protein [Argiope bruennichi]
MFVPPNLAIGDNIQLLCTVKRGSNPVEIEWLHNGKKITSIQKNKIITYEDSSHLSVGKIQPEDIGNYTCVAKNRKGQDSYTVTLIIEGKYGIESQYNMIKKMTVFANSNYVLLWWWILYKIVLISSNDSHPTILTPMYVPPNLAIGDITEIYCNIKRGSFPVNFSWFHNNDELTNKQKYKITNSETSSHLYIGKIKASDIGNYTCIATNRFGQDSGMLSKMIFCYRKMIISTKSEGIKCFMCMMFIYLPLNIHIVKAEEPVLNPLIIPPNLSLGDNTELLCTLKRGSLPFTFKWLHNGIDVTEKKKNNIGMSKMSTLLSIGKIQASDIGNYTCVVTNRLGEDRKSIQVLIEGQFKLQIDLKCL